MTLEEAIKNVEKVFGKETISNLKFEYGITLGSEPQHTESTTYTIECSAVVLNPPLEPPLPKSTYQHQEPPPCRCHSTKQGRSAKQIKKDHKRKKQK